MRLSVFKKRQPALNLSISVDAAKKRLSISLNNIMAFASETKSEYWKEVFKKADKTLNSPNPVVEYYKDFIIEDQYSLQNKQLLFSASLANVFGGMGSWNDRVYANKEQEKTNTRLSSDLYDKINEAVIVAINNN